MKNASTTLPALVLACLLIGGGPAAAAGAVTFEGTRDHLRTLCETIGGDLTEIAGPGGLGQSICIGSDSAVTCGEDDICLGRGPIFVSGPIGIPSRNGIYVPPTATSLDTVKTGGIGEDSPNSWEPLIPVKLPPR